MFLSKRGLLYYLYYSDPSTGKRNKISTGSKTKTEAYQFLRAFDAKNRINKNSSPSYLISEFKDEFLTYSLSVHTKNTQRCVKTSFEQLIRVVGDIQVRDITVRHIERFVAEKIRNTSAWTARKHFAHLTSAFERAIIWKQIDTNPFRDVPVPKTPRRIPTYFTHEQLSTLMQIIDNPDFLDLVITAVTTGMRMGEMINLHWSSVSIERNTIIVENTNEFTTKSKRNRLVPINRHLIPILQRRKESSICNLVFHRNGIPYTTDYVTKRFKKYVRKAKLDDRLHFHSLRHSTASYLVQAGVPIYTVMELLGHSQISTTQVYSHLSSSQLVESVNQINLPNRPLRLNS